MKCKCKLKDFMIGIQKVINEINLKNKNSIIHCKPPQIIKINFNNNLIQIQQQQQHKSKLRIRF